MNQFGDEMSAELNLVLMWFFYFNKLWINRQQWRVRRWSQQEGHQELHCTCNINLTFLQKSVFEMMQFSNFNFISWTWCIIMNIDQLWNGCFSIMNPTLLNAENNCVCTASIRTFSVLWKNNAYFSQLASLIITITVIGNNVKLTPLFTVNILLQVAIISVLCWSERIHQVSLALCGRSLAN